MSNISGITKRFYYLASGYADYKMGPFNDIQDLCSKVDPFDFFEGMMVVLLNENGEGPGIYWFISNRWERIPLGAAEVQDAIKALESKNAEQDQKIAKNEQSLSEQIAKIAGIETKVSNVETRVGTLEQKIENISGGKPEVDSNSLEYADTGVGEQLKVKLAPAVKDSEGNAENAHLSSDAAGISVVIPITGDDVGNEVRYI